MHAGRLFLIPVALGATEWTTFLPTSVRDSVLRLDYFIVENAKSARAELKHLDYDRPLRETRIDALPDTPTIADLDRLLQPIVGGIDGGLMSDAGCPAVADPGALLVRQAHKAGVRVVPLVGPSSLLLALMASGLNGQSFAFHGYLPVADAARKDAIRRLENESRQSDRTQLFIETPYRNLRMFDALLQTCQPGTLLCVACDLTTATENVATRTVGEWRKLAPPDLDRRPTVFLMLASRSAKTHL